MSMSRFLPRERALTATTSMGRPQRASELVAFVVQQMRNDGRADGSQPGKTDFQRLGHKRR
jgi:hypothetical protein